MTGWQTLLYKEVLRFWKVSFQTVAAPVLTAVLYMLIFGHVLEDHVKIFGQVSYTAFLVPGLVMMLHKPLGMTCSRKEDGALVYDVLPPRWRRRDPAISTIGRLDKQTTGLLLLTDDARLSERRAPVIHRQQNHPGVGGAPLHRLTAVVGADDHSCPRPQL